LPFVIEEKPSRKPITEIESGCVLGHLSIGGRYIRRALPIFLFLFKINHGHLGPSETVDDSNICGTFTLNIARSAIPCS
jgi:hypothetical protein